MQVISLFSGIGGFELAARWMGWDNIVSCEINPFGQKVLKHHFPNSYHHSDIKTLDYETIKKESRYNPSKSTILVGGFPCQPFSVAGKQQAQNDDRHLWPEMLRIIRQIKPTYIVAENVKGLLTIKNGMAFESVCKSMENEGYEVQPFIIPACAVGAPHRRDRLWFVAYSGLFQRDKERTQELNIRTRRQTRSNINGDGGKRILAYSNSKRLRGEVDRERESGQFNETSKKPNWENFPTQSPFFGGNDGVPTRLDGLSVSKFRRESMKAYGNAIVPQVVYQIFQAINQIK